MYLGPARDSRLDAVTIVVAVDVAVEELNELGALRPGADEAHVAANDVDQLRKLVERGPAQEHPETGAAILSLHSARPEVDGGTVRLRRVAGAAHRAELQHLEHPAVTPDATLEDVATIMHDRGVNSVPVVDTDNKVVGIVARADVVRFIARTT